MISVLEDAIRIHLIGGVCLGEGKPAEGGRWYFHSDCHEVAAMNGFYPSRSFLAAKLTVVCFGGEDEDDENQD